MKIELKNNKRYEKCKISTDASIFEGYVGDYHVDASILKRLAKDLGFSYELYKIVSNVSLDAAKNLLTFMSNKSNHEEITLLLDDELKEVVGYSLEDRVPVLNTDFISRVKSLVETSTEVEISDYHYTSEDAISYVIIKRKLPIVIEEKYMNSDITLVDYHVGILLVNDELNNSYSRLVLHIDTQPLYLPSTYYSTTTSRYKRSTGSSVEALEVLVLKIIDDLRGDELKNRLYDLHYRYRANKNILSSYEEYNVVLRSMRKIPSIIEDNSSLEGLLAKYESFERKYSHLEDKKSSYVWRCTALSDITVGALVSTTISIMNELCAPSIEYFAVRELLGSYISTNRIAEDIAKEDSL